MRLAVALLFLMFLVGTAEAQTYPVGIGVIAIKETLKVGGGCDSLSIQDSIAFATYANGTWAADTNSGIYSGSLTPADAKGRSWYLEFDDISLAQYENYLEAVASGLCQTGVSIVSGSIDAFAIKFGKNGSQVSLQLKTSASGVTIYGTGKGKHSIKGKGGFAPGI